MQFMLQQPEPMEELKSENSHYTPSQFQLDV